MNAGEWKRDEDGCYYRMIGNCKEYAMDYIFAYTDTEKKKNMTPQQTETKKCSERICPFNKGVASKCSIECPLYGKSACTLSMTEKPPEKDTRGRRCPISGKQCNELCALYFNGCGIIKIVKGLKAGKEN